ncbi:MAG: hypothetical protein FJY10_08525 [Bacteroidetes bacterium]|nr:hypothetical protein [Bacteroidota bacterium]
MGLVERDGHEPDNVLLLWAKLRFFTVKRRKPGNDILRMLAGKWKPVYAVYAFIPALILNVILNYLWIPVYGATGAAWATNISYTFGTAIFLLFYTRVIRISPAELIHFRLQDFSFIRHPQKLIKWNQPN